MRFTTIAATCLFSLTSSSAFAAQDYRDCVGATVRVDTPLQLQQLKATATRILEDHPSIGPLNAVLCNDQPARLTEQGLSFSVVTTQLGQKISNERERLTAPSRFSTLRADGAEWFDDFKNLSSIEQRLEHYAASYPEFVELENIGSSLEGRAIRMLKIRVQNSGAPRKPGLFYIGTQHAREWMSPMSVMYTVDQLVTQYGRDAQITELLNQVDVYVVPVVNPDGFEYTWAEDGDRYWRKNRRENADGSFGIDLNRNWPQGFGLDIGSSSQASSNVYRGTAPFSEPETAAVRDAVDALPDLAGFIDFHAFSQLVLYGPGYYYGGAGKLVEEECVATHIAREISALNGAYYRQLPIPALYPTTGASTDWSRAHKHLKSLAMEVRPSRYGDGGDFVTSPGQIVPTGQEQLAVVLSTMRWILGEFSSKQSCDQDTFSCVERCHVESACREDIIKYNELAGEDRVSTITYDYHGTTFHFCVHRCELQTGAAQRNGCFESRQAYNRCIGRSTCDAYLAKSCEPVLDEMKKACDIDQGTTTTTGGATETSTSGSTSGSTHTQGPSTDLTGTTSSPADTSPTDSGTSGGSGGSGSLPGGVLVDCQSSLAGGTNSQRPWAALLILLFGAGQLRRRR